MFNLSTKQTILIAVVFSLVLWATRGQHVASLLSLPDATWAIAFILTHRPASARRQKPAR